MLEKLKDFNIILASNSPRRRQLLEETGFEFIVKPVTGIDETHPVQLKGKGITEFLAMHKAAHYRNIAGNNTIVITADTIVWHKGAVINKPCDFDDAVRILEKLSDSMHVVYTSVCLTSGTKQIVFSSGSKVWFNKVPKDTILRYIREKQPFDKAGAYGVQECLPAGLNPCSPEERLFIEKINKPCLLENSLNIEPGNNYNIIKRIDGSYFNVMGLPVHLLWEKLEKFESEDLQKKAEIN